MASERLYYDDAYTVRFRSRVAATERQGTRAAVELESTYFYPEGGGQLGDRGRLDGVRVLDVQISDDGRVWHVLEGPGPVAEEVEAEVDWDRRFDHMQQHTGQHILSAAFERTANAPTLSSTLGEERSVIEVAASDSDWRQVERVEEAANRILWEDRPIALHWVDGEGAKRFDLRKAPVVSGLIRIVEIPGWDASACGGTHTRRTGEVGSIKVVRWEKVRGNVRFEFLCGARALRDHGWRTEMMLEAARRHTLKDRELIAHLERAALERDELRKGLTALTGRLIEAEARERTGVPPQGVAVFDAQRPREEVRLLALKSLEAGAPWVVVGAAAPEPVIVIGRPRGVAGPLPERGESLASPSRGRSPEGESEPQGAGRGPGELSLDLRTLLPGLRERAQGKGGGSPELVQVAASGRQTAEDAWRWALEAVRRAMEDS
jgi:alanyl-tRNA synthetase